MSHPTENVERFLVFLMVQNGLLQDLLDDEQDILK